MSKETIYWKQRNGVLISVDNMDINHLRNAFKHLIKHHNTIVQQTNEVVDKYNILIKKRKAETNFQLNGDIANFFNEEQDNSYQNDYYETKIH